jgi:hypothetical protein
MGFADLANDLTEGFDGILNAFGLDETTHPYPTPIAEKVTNIKVDESDKSWRKSLGYGFKVVRVPAEGGTGKPADGWGDFVLQINPQELTQDEIFAIEVTPTFSGVLVEHQGTTLKDITISGTTGVSPKRAGSGGALPQSGRPALAAGRSGYYEFQELRSYIRTYVENKRSDPDSTKGELRLVWQNFRDHEDLYVEPQKFTMKRSSAKPHMYDYTIVLKAIGIASLDPKEKGWLEALDDFIEDVQDTLDTATKIMQGGVDFLERAEREVSNTVLGPARSLGAFMREYKTAGKRLTAAGKRVRSLGTRSRNTFDALSNVHDDTPSREAVKDLEAKMAEVYAYAASIAGIDTSGLPYTALDIATGKQPTYDELNALNALKNAKIAVSKCLQENKLFDKKQNEEIKDAVESFYNEAKLTKVQKANKKILADLQKERDELLTKGDIAGAAEVQQEIDEVENQINAANDATAKKFYFLASDSARVDKVGGGETIQTLAARELGDPDRFKDIAIFNNLVPPYIDPTPLDEDPVRVPGVLRPGDEIYIPQSGQNLPNLNVKKTIPYPITTGMSEAEKNFGTDLQLDNEYDLVTASNKDMDMVAGSNNVVQSILLKILLQRGSLKRHPEIGTDLNIGNKISDPVAIADQIRTTLNQDNRVEAVVFSEVKQEGGTTFINMILKLRGVDQPVDFPVPLPAMAA